MAKINFEIAHLAHLARLDLTESEQTRFGLELGRVLGFVEQLQAIPTEGVAETAQVTGLVNVLREDIDHKLAVNSEQYEDLRKERAKLLAAVPKLEQAMVKVPAIL